MEVYLIYSIVLVSGKVIQSYMYMCIYIIIMYM